MRSRTWRFISEICKNAKYYKQAVLVRRKSYTACLLLSVPFKLSCDSTVKLQEPDATKLSREYLIKSSSVITAENSSILHTQVALALQQAQVDYKEALLALVFLLEFKLTVLGYPQEEARIGSLILEARSLVSNSKKKRDELEILFNRTEVIVNTAAEVTFMTGSDVVGSSAGHRLLQADQVVREEKIKSEEAEKKLQDTEVKVINVEGKYAEEHADELEKERQQILQDLGGGQSQSEQETETEKSTEDLDVIDILGTLDETLSDDKAEEL